ncbi:MAG: AI-2E family transporter, partial [Terriglobia bacterium]
AFYLFRDGPALLARLRDALPLDEAYREGLFFIAQNTLYANVFSSFVVAAGQGIVGGLTFWLLGIGAPVLWGMAIGFLSLFPVLGPWLIWLPGVAFLVVQAYYLKGVILLAVGALIITMAENVLRPRLIGRRPQLNSLVVFISIVGGLAAFGLVGIVLGPILVALGDAVLEVAAAARAQPPPPA